MEVDGRRIGVEDDVAWIRDATVVGMAITAAIPPVFEAYATVLVADQDQGRGDEWAQLVGLLAGQSPDQP